MGQQKRYPYSIVWSPIPGITWFFPYIGHMGRLGHANGLQIVLCCFIELMLLGNLKCIIIRAGDIEDSGLVGTSKPCGSKLLSVGCCCATVLAANLIRCNHMYRPTKVAVIFLYTICAGEFLDFAAMARRYSPRSQYSLVDWKLCSRYGWLPGDRLPSSALIN